MVQPRRPNQLHFASELRVNRMFLRLVFCFPTEFWHRWFWEEPQFLLLFWFVKEFFRFLLLVVFSHNKHAYYFIISSLKWKWKYTDKCRILSRLRNDANVYFLDFVTVSFDLTFNGLNTHFNDFMRFLPSQACPTIAWFCFFIFRYSLNVTHLVLILWTKLKYAH